MAAERGRGRFSKVPEPEPWLDDELDPWDPDFDQPKEEEIPPDIAARMAADLTPIVTPASSVSDLPIAVPTRRFVGPKAVESPPMKVTATPTVVENVPTKPKEPELNENVPPVPKPQDKINFPPVSKPQDKNTSSEISASNVPLPRKRFTSLKKPENEDVPQSRDLLKELNMNAPVPFPEMMRRHRPDSSLFVEKDSLEGFSSVTGEVFVPDVGYVNFIPSNDSTKMMVEYRDNLSVYYPAEVLEVMDGGVRLKFVDEVLPSAWYSIGDCRYVKYQMDDRVFKVGDVVDVCLPQKTGKFGYQRAKISDINADNYLHFEVLEGPAYGMAVSVDECRDISCVQPLSEGLHLTTLNIPKNMQADKDVLSPILVKRFPCCVIQKSKDGTSFVIYSLDPTVIACIDAGSDLLIEEFEDALSSSKVILKFKIHKELMPYTLANIEAARDVNGVTDVINYPCVDDRTYQVVEVFAKNYPAAVTAKNLLYFYAETIKIPTRFYKILEENDGKVFQDIINKSSVEAIDVEAEDVGKTGLKLTGTEKTVKIAKFLIDSHVRKVQRKVGIQKSTSVVNSRRSSFANDRQPSNRFESRFSRPEGFGMNR